MKSSNRLILCCTLFLLLSIFPSIRAFTIELALHIRWPKYWSFSFSISPSNEYSGLISFRVDRFDLLAVQGTLKNLLQHHNLKASILRYSAFFTVQLSYPYMTTGKTIALTQFSCVRLFTTPWTEAHQASLSITNSWSLLKLMSIESVMPSTHLSSVVPFSCCPQSFPRSGAFPMSQFFASGGQSNAASASVSPFQ